MIQDFLKIAEAFEDALSQRVVWTSAFSTRH